MDFYDDLREQQRELLRQRVRRITWAKGPDGEDVPIEACFLCILAPGDEERARKAPGFVPTDRYPTWMRLTPGEIGAISGARLVVDQQHSGLPKLFGADEREFYVGEAA